MDVNSDDAKQLTDAIRMRYGLNLGLYADDSLRRRIKYAARRIEITQFSELITTLLASPDHYYAFVGHLSVSVSEMFRDPAAFAFITQELFPKFEAYPYLKIWHAGCAHGEEVFSMMILLKEQGLLDRTLVYATDNNPQALHRARQGIYEKSGLSAIETRYAAAGGLGNVRDYLIFSRFSTMMIKPYLRERIVFAHHDLTTHTEFSHFQFILCRNVFIYFSEEMRRHAANLFAQSLYPEGVLCLGRHESLPTSDARFSPVHKVLNIYRYCDQSN
ncbi:MAG: protein-glutamate O-methyltransferase CheR [Gammaproteobacteria bacterium]|nr:protein-glutamate O-methyltransferase CheR [Gammaproteobacteria bacterium]